MTPVLVIPLGEAPRAQVEAAVRAHFPDADVNWANRRDLRTLCAGAYDDAVLVAPDLAQRRLRITSLLLALVRAKRRWRIDLRGRCQQFRLPLHVAANAVPVARHVLACALAAVVAEPALPAVRQLTRTQHKQHKQRTTQRQRVLYLRSQLWLGLEGGGSVAHTAGVINGLRAADAGVQVVSSDRLAGVDQPVQVVTPETWFDGNWRELEELAYNTAFFQAALHAARRCKPTVIYQRHTAFNVAGALLARLLHVPLVLEYNSSELWKGTYWGGLHRRRAAELVEQTNLEAASRVVVVSRVLRDELVSQGVARDKITINPNGVDPAQFRPDLDAGPVRGRYNIQTDEVVVGFSGTFGLWHGIPTLAQAVDRVSHARWLLMGDGPLRHLVEQPRPHVTLTGLVPHADMPAHLAACDILVSPHGRQADGGEFFGSPTKLYEYMAMGKAIVASAVGQIAEVLEDERTALLVPPDDPEALASAIARLIADPRLRSRIGTAAREQAVAHHTWAQNAQRVLASLEQ